MDKTECPFTCATANHLGWQAGFIAGVIYELIARDLRWGDIGLLSPEKWKDVIGGAFEFAANAASNSDNCIAPDFARKKSALLPQQ